MKKVVFLTSSILILFSCGVDDSSNTMQKEVRVVERKTCGVCYKSYTGSGYQAFGQEFCSMKCYVDK
jgi:hypothetical protein